MSKIIIIGSSAAGFSACGHLLKSAPDAQVTLVTQEDAAFYRKDLLFDYLAGQVKERDLLLCDEDFYQNKNLVFLRNSKVIRLDTRRKLLYLKDEKEKLGYDYLIIASGQKIVPPQIPGAGKEGVVLFYTKQEAEKVRSALPLADTICLIGEAQSCLRLVEIMAQKNKEIKVISSPPADSFVSSPKVEWIFDSAPAEIIFEGAELKAVKLDNKKIFAASLVIFTGGFRPCTEFLKDSQIKTTQDYIVVDEQFTTNIEDVFACGSVCARLDYTLQPKLWDTAVNEGILAAGNLIKAMERRKASCQQSC